MEKLAFSLVIAAGKLGPYFQAHVINVLTDHPLKKAMNKLEAARRLNKQAMELSEFDVRYRPREAIKAQALADFIATFTPTSNKQNEGQGAKHQVVHMHGSSTQHAEELGLFYTHQKGIILSMQSVYISRQPIMKLNIKPYFRAQRQLSHFEQIQSSSTETHGW